MSLKRLLLAQIQYQDVVAGWRASRVSRYEYGLVLGAVALICLVIFLWATFIRKPGRRRKYKYPTVERKNDSPATRADAPVEVIRTPRKRRRHRRKKHRPRNPTLAETGGLPPVRDEWPGSS